MAIRASKYSIRLPNDPQERARATALPEYPICRTRDWLGRERLSIRANGRRYLYHSLEAAQHGRNKLWGDYLRQVDGLPTRGARRRRRAAALAIALALVALALWRYPPLLLRAADTARAVTGPAPVAYAETLAFRVGTLIRQARVQIDNTAPRWRLEDETARSGTAVPTPARPAPEPTAPAPTPAAIQAAPAPYTESRSGVAN